MKKPFLILIALLCSLASFAQTTSVRDTVKSLQGQDTLYTITVTATTVAKSTTTSLHKYVAPVPVPGLPGGPALATTPYANLKNTTISNRTVSGGTLTLNNCSGVHITGIRFDGGKGTNLYALVINNCSNIIIDYNYFTMYCKFFMVQNSTGIIIRNNQGLNLYEPVIYNKDFAHAIQCVNVTGANNQITNNAFENIQDIAVNPHDIINLVNCSGTSASHFLVSGNMIRGGMVTDGFGKGTGAGITMDNGSWIDVVNNTFVSPGCAAIQANQYQGGSHSNVLIDGNIIVSLIKSNVASDAIIALGPKTNVTISNNKVNWIKYNGVTGTGYKGGEVLYWFGGQLPPPGITLSNNTFNTGLTANVLPATIITYNK